MGKMLLGMVIFLCAGVVLASNTSEGAVAFKANAKVVVGVDGVPTEVIASPKLPEPIRRAIEERVAQWRFEPLVIDGKPRSGATYVFLDACALQRDDGELRVAMEYLWNGPGYADGELRHPLPTYPTEAELDGAEGSFKLLLAIGTDGVASIESIERQSGARRLFEPTLRAWVTSLRYAPEEVDGVPVATRISIPIDFTVSGPSPPRSKDARRLAAARGSSACATASQGGAPANPVVLDSPFKLLGVEG